MRPWPRRRHSNTQITIASHATFLSHYWIKWNGTTARRYRLATMLVRDVLFGHFHRISSNVEIIGSLVQCSAMSAIDVPLRVNRVVFEVGRLRPVFILERTSSGP